MIFHQNVRSIRNKVEELEVFLMTSTNTYDFVCLTEHFLASEEIVSLKVTGYTTASSFCRVEHCHGGTMILVKDGAVFTERKDLVDLSSEMNYEVAAVEARQLNLVVVAIYRPPGGNFNVFMSGMVNMFEILSVSFKYVVIVGDFNIHFNNLTNNCTVYFTDLVNSYGFTQQIFNNTRLNACIDNVFINFNDVLEFRADIIEAVLSDHQALHVGVRVDDVPDIRLSKYIIHRPITQYGINNMYSLLQRLDWGFLRSSCSPDDKAGEFTRIIVGAMCSSFPEKKKRVKVGQHVSWFNDNLRQMRETPGFLNDFYRNHQSAGVALQVRQFRARYKEADCAAKKEANSDFIRRSDNPVGAAWKIVNENRGAARRAAPPDISASDFNDFFSTIADKILRDIPDTNIEAANFLQRMEVLFPVEGFSFSEVTFIQVRNAIEKLKNKHSLDIYGTSVTLLKKLKDTYIIPLTKLVNCCIREGVYPSCFKKSKVVPVFKKGDKDDINNYRPISLIPAVSKVFELLLKEQLYNYLESNSILNNFQFGFRKGKSTTLAIMDFLEYVVEGFERGEHVGGTLCDLSKAFDCISHEVLLIKLDWYGLSNVSAQLMRSYLTGRTQSVWVNGVSSQEMPIRHGVPQGSILGPLLFIIYINDICAATDRRLILFADDTTALCSGKSLTDLEASMAGVVTELRQWFCANNLTLNVNKTEKIIFSLRDVGNGVGGANGVVRFLGVQLDSRLIFENHVDAVASKITRSIFLLKNLCRTVEKSVVLMVFHALVQSLCNFSLLAWGHAPQSERIFGLQRRALRVVEGLDYGADVRASFVKLRVLTLPCRYIFDCIIYMKKNSGNYSMCSELHSYNTRQSDSVYINSLRLKRSSIATLYYAPVFFNKIPREIRALNDKDFTASIRTFLCDNAFYSIDEFLTAKF